MMKRFFCVALVGAVLGVLPDSGLELRAQDVGTDSRMAEVMRTVGGLLENAHISGHALDDEMSRRAYEAYLESLDPYKVYFTQSDIDAFAVLVDRIDDMVRKGDPTFAHIVFARYLKRLGERVAIIEELLKGPFDFTVDEAFVTDPETARYAGSEEEVRNLWRRRLKLDLLSLKADKVEDKEARERILKRYQRFLDRMRQENDSDVVSRFINSMATSYDPHTVYMAPKVFEDFEIAVTLNYQGIGALLGQEDDYIVVNRVIPGGAAEKDGRLKAKDKIAAIGQGQNGEMVDVVGMRTDDVVKLIRGKENTIVRLGILPASGGPMKIYALNRARIELQESTATGEVIEHGIGADGKPLRIGVIDLPSFYRDTNGQRAENEEFRSSTRDVERILEDFTRQGVDAVVLDLRRNGGGFLPEAVGISGLFTDGGPMVQVQASGRRARRLRDPGPGMAWSGPLVVLTSRASASASEIVAGAIQDYERGLIVGDVSTHGKGTVQTTVDVANHADGRPPQHSLGVLKLTFQQFYRPSGLGTQLEGVHSDIELPSWTGVFDEGEAKLPFALPHSSIAPASHARLGRVDPGLVAELRSKSAARRAASEFFAKLAERIAIYRKLRDRKTITLNEERYLAMQAELQAGMEEAEQATSQPVPGEAAPEKPAEPDPWMAEILSITADYVDLLARRATK